MIRLLRVPIAMLAAVLTACTPAAPTAAPPPPPVPAAEQIADKITIGHPVVLPNLDPHVGGSSQTGALAFQGFFDSIVKVDDDGKPKPWLATSWKSNDPTTWQFTLRTDVKYSNGEQFEAATVKWNIERVLDPATKATLRGTLGTIRAVEVVDPANVIIRTNGPDPLIVNRLSSVLMAPPKYFAQIGEAAFLGGKAIGTGPYTLKTWIPDDRIVLVVSENSWRGKPKTPEVEIRFTPDRTTLLAGMRTGDIDLAFDLFPDQVVQLNNAGFRVDQKLYPGLWFFELDTRGFAAFGDKRVRQAINYGVNKEAIVKQLFSGFGEVAPGQLISKFGNGYNPDVKAYPYDPAKARQLLAEAGYANGLKVRANITAGGKPFAEAAAGMLKEVGFEVDVQIIDFGVFSTRNATGPIENLWGWRPADGPTRDADTPYLNWTDRSAQAEGRISWRHPRFEELYTQQRTELDATKRLKILHEMVALYREEAPVLFGYNPSQHYSLNPKIRDFFSHPDVSIDVEKVYKVK